MVGIDSNSLVVNQGTHVLIGGELVPAVVAEWLRRWTRNPLGYSRTGSNPVGSDHFEWHCQPLSTVQRSVQVYQPPNFISCRGRVVKAMDLKSIGVSPHRFEPCRQRSVLCVIQHVYCVLVRIQPTNLGRYMLTTDNFEL